MVNMEGSFLQTLEACFLGLGLICSFVTHSLWHNQTRVTLVNTLGSASIKLLSIDPISWGALISSSLPTDRDFYIVMLELCLSCSAESHQYTSIWIASPVGLMPRIWGMFNLKSHTHGEKRSSVLIFLGEWSSLGQAALFYFEQPPPAMQAPLMPDLDGGG